MVTLLLELILIQKSRKIHWKSFMLYPYGLTYKEYKRTIQDLLGENQNFCRNIILHDYIYIVAQAERSIHTVLLHLHLVLAPFILRTKGQAGSLLQRSLFNP